MYKTNYDTTGLLWNFDEKDTFESRKWDSHALDLLEEMDREQKTTTGSRLVGAAIQFVYPDGFVRREEERAENELAAEGVNIRKSNIHTISDDGLFTDVSKQAELVSYTEFDSDSYSGVRAEISLPKSVLDAVEKACAEAEHYNLNQKSRFLSNSIIAFEDSQFSSVFERVETKLQLLRYIRGEEISEPTAVFELIKEENEFCKQLHEEVFQADDSIELAEIDPSDPIELPPKYSDVDFAEVAEMGKTHSDRTGAFLSYMKSYFGLENGVTYDSLVKNFDRTNSDYSDAGRFIRDNVIEYLVRGADGQFYLSEEDAPAGGNEEVYENRMAIAKLLKAMTVPQKQDRKPSAAVRNNAGDEAAERVKEDSDGLGYDVEALAKNLSVSELQDCLEYMCEPLDKKTQKSIVRKKVDGLTTDDLVYYSKSSELEQE